MKFFNFLNEKVTKNVIVVDVQPTYEKWINFDIEEFADFLLEQREILYFYNGESMGFDDSTKGITQWLCEYNPDLFDKLNNDTLWIDKGYGFFRSWMDMGDDIGFIKKAIRFMMDNKVYDSRDIESDKWEENFPNDWKDNFELDPIYLPEISPKTLKQWNGGYIVGGGKNECLKEIQIWMSVFNIKAKEVKKFIY